MYYQNDKPWYIQYELNRTAGMDDVNSDDIVQNKHTKLLNIKINFDLAINIQRECLFYNLSNNYTIHVNL